MSSLMDECQEGLPLECLNDLSIIQMTDRPICHLNDCPYLPILTIKNGRITAVFGRMASTISLGSSLVSLGFFVLPFLCSFC